MYKVTAVGVSGRSISGTHFDEPLDTPVEAPSKLERLSDFSFPESSHHDLDSLKSEKMRYRFFGPKTVCFDISNLKTFPRENVVLNTFNSRFFSFVRGRSYIVTSTEPSSVYVFRWL